MQPLICLGCGLKLAAPDFDRPGTKCPRCGNDLPTPPAPPASLVPQGRGAGGEEGPPLSRPSTDTGQIQPASGSSVGTAKSSWRIRAGSPTGGALRRIARFEVTGALGKGAFGEVWRAYDPNLDREVALKVPRFDDATGKEAERFFREARAAAQLHHPNIVAIHDAGDSDGQFYIASELIEGLPLSVWLKENTPSFEQTAEIIRKLAEALHYAHSQGIFHRDIKPANVMISSPSISGSAADGDGETPTTTESDPHSPVPRTRGRGVRGEGDNEPHLMDFGLARRPDQEATMTMDGALVGTPSYMSPEQAGGKGRQADARSDIYSLGVVLYEMLAGRKPFDGPPPVVMHKILTEEPESPRKIDPKVPPDLNTICLKCLAKEPARRYSSAQHLADELQRWLKGEPIQARPIKGPERLWRWCRRNPAFAGLLGLAMLGLAGVIVLSISFAVHYSQAANAIQTEQETTQKALVDSQELRRQSEVRNADLTLNQAIALCEQGEIGRGLLQMAEALEIATRAEAKDLEWAIRVNLDGWSRELHRCTAILGHPAPVLAVALSPDGKTVMTGCEDAKARFWDAATGKQIGPTIEHPGPISHVAFFADGKQALTGSPKGGLKLWDATSGSTIPLAIQTAGDVTCLTVTIDGKKALFCTGDKAQVWDVATGKPFGNPLLPGGAIRHVALSADGGTALTTTWQGNWQVSLWDAGTGKLINRTARTDGRRIFVALSPDGQTAITGGTFQFLAWIWESKTGKVKCPSLQHQGAVSVGAFDPDAKVVLTGSDEGTARFWDTSTGNLLRPPLLHRDRLRAVAFHPDGRSVITGSDDGTARLWTLAEGNRIGTVLPHPEGGMMSSVFSPDGSQLLTGSGVAGNAGSARLWEVPTGKLLATLTHPYAVNDARFSRDGKTIVTAGPQQVKLWDTVTRKPIDPPLLHEDNVFGAAFTPDGKNLVTAALNNKAQLWDTATRKPIGPPMQHGNWIRGLALSPDGKLAATGCDDKKGRIWDLATASLAVPPLEHQGNVIGVAFSPDGRTLATASADTTVRFWNVETGKQVGPLIKHKAPIEWVAFSSDGRIVASASWDAAGRLWDSVTGKMLGPPFPHKDALMTVAFSPDGALVFTGANDTVGQMWRVPAPLRGTTEQVFLWTEMITGLKQEENRLVQALDASTWHKHRQRLEELGGPPVR